MWNDKLQSRKFENQSQNQVYFRVGFVAHDSQKSRRKYKYWKSNVKSKIEIYSKNTV